ncbi:alpha/beta-hydrolase [Periconia macrospinosa]|uniref:Carboxylic ester hydrolase n=1 Tax=Periconia macrospinosa TaxID=97972 RepID=A0A2V1EAU2_9PLEO|nr:alpha/beta-hydrolase [Periconia macrospinosa]
MVSSFFLFPLFALCVQQVISVDTVVDLGYAKYRGNSSNGISVWAGLRYARNPSRVDGMRFAAPQDPQPVEGIVNATKFGAICIGTDTKLTSEFDPQVSEDCLFANVWAPTNATADSNLPVYVFIQGGGFCVNGNPNYDATKLIKAGDNKMVVVNFNYRVGPYGFLASKEFLENNTLSLNNGLKDQRQLLKWVNTHISKFGGDPNHVTLGGASAGAGSVIFQLTAFGGRDDKLIQGAIAESPATPPTRDVNESQWQYDALLKQSGCADFHCLINLDAVTFQKAVRDLKKPYPGATGPPIFFWNPTLDRDFVRDYTYNEFRNNNFLKVPTIIGDTTNEGLGFTGKSVMSKKLAYQFIVDQFPSLNPKDQEAVQAAWGGPQNANQDPLWRNTAADIYGHIRYNCPGLNFSKSFAENGSAPTYQYRWNVGNALHVEELGSVWGGGPIAPSQFIQAYWTSFIRSFDPNKYPVTFKDADPQFSSPTWEKFGVSNAQWMLFNNSNVVQMDPVPQSEMSRCGLISGLQLQMTET